MKVSVCNPQRLPGIDTALLKQIARAVLARLGADAASTAVSIVLVSDQRIARLNREFLDTDGPTDVLSFAYHETGLTGELIVSVERAADHARRWRTTPGRELALYVIHGLLHLHGYDDRTPRQRARMRAAERRLLRSLGKGLDPDRLLRRRRPLRAR
jgi:probable rRNA maturation factor